MNRLLLAIRIFFRTLANAATAEQTALVLSGKLQTAPAARESKPSEPKRADKPPVRSEALTLLATLQREARLVDFLREDLAGYNDAQIGAAVRDIHRDSAAVIERVFALRPVVEAAEGDNVMVPTGFESAAYHLVGQVTGQPPFQGRLCHHGWQATRADLPAWTGTPAAAAIIAPAEVEL